MATHLLIPIEDVEDYIQEHKNDEMIFNLGVLKGYKDVLQKGKQISLNEEINHGVVKDFIKNNPNAGKSFSFCEGYKQALIDLLK